MSSPAHSETPTSTGDGVQVPVVPVDILVEQPGAGVAAAWWFVEVLGVPTPFPLSPHPPDASTLCVRLFGVPDALLCSGLLG